MLKLEDWSTMSTIGLIFRRVLKFLDHTSEKSARVDSWSSRKTFLNWAKTRSTAADDGWRRATVLKHSYHVGMTLDIRFQKSKRSETSGSKVVRVMIQQLNHEHVDLRHHVFTAFRFHNRWREK